MTLVQLTVAFSHISQIKKKRRLYFLTYICANKFSAETEDSGISHLWGENLFSPKICNCWHILPLDSILSLCPFICHKLLKENGVRKVKLCSLPTTVDENRCQNEELSNFPNLVVGNPQWCAKW